MRLSDPIASASNLSVNVEKLWEAQASFLVAYPEGFNDPEIQSIRRKHNVPRLIDFAQANLTRLQCANPEHVASTLRALISRSSMVSRFEKPAFGRFLDALGSPEKEALARAVEQRLHGRRKQGFEQLVAMLAEHGLARWSLVSAVPFYFAPRREVFMKPTTVKQILRKLEVEDLHYRPRPTWAFYRGFRDLIAEVRREVSPTLSPNNAALTGFLMMSL